MSFTNILIAMKGCAWKWIRSMGSLEGRGITLREILRVGGGEYDSRGTTPEGTRRGAEG